jgi:putative restriction endonuclease
MPALTNESLFRRLWAALPAGTTFRTPENAIHPAEFSIPGFGDVRAYLFTVTRDRSIQGRPLDEYKIQLIIDGQARRARASLDLHGAYTILLGFSPDFGVFVGWEARLYLGFAYSANVQVREPILLEARDSGWAVGEPRELKGSTEVRIAFTPGNLMSYLRAGREGDRQELEGHWREAFMLSKAPNSRAEHLPARTRDLDGYVQRERQKIISMRLSRDSKFAPRVKEQFDHFCAVCAVQLGIVEAAHIIPVNDPRGNDEIWNGLSLCPNHHTLFDARRFVVEVSLEITIDDETIAFLHETGRTSGIELLTLYRGRRIRPPQFWQSSREWREKMQDALDYNRRLTGIPA